jgi:hypothetical protein
LKPRHEDEYPSTVIDVYTASGEVNIGNLTILWRRHHAYDGRNLSANFFWVNNGLEPLDYAYR